MNYRPVTGQEQKAYYVTGVASSTGAKVFYLQPAPGKAWRLLGATIQGQADGTTTTNNASISLYTSTVGPYAISRVTGFTSFTGVYSYFQAALLLGGTTTSCDGTGTPFTFDGTLHPDIIICPGMEIMGRIYVNSKTTNETYQMVILVEEYDLPK